MDAVVSRERLERFAALLNEAKKREERKRQAGRRGLLEFVRYFWPVLEPQTELVEGWPLEAICRHLEAVTFGEITRLLENVPPGFMKSLTTSVFWPAWEWGPMNRPHERYVTFSYSASLTERDNLRFRDLILSPEYQLLWGDRFRLRKIGETLVSNDKTGWKLASSVGGVGTGQRGSRAIIDDPHNVKEAESDTVRSETVRWFQESIENRLNDLKRDAIVVIMQRVHELDVAGAIIENGDYEHLYIPFDFERGRRCKTKIGWIDPRTEDDESAWPERFPAEQMLPFRRRQYMWSGQYQQRPEPRGGGIFKRHWWQIWDDKAAERCGVAQGRYPGFEYVLAVLDTAYTEKEENDPCAMTVWGVWHDPQGIPQVMLAHAWEEWLEFNPLVEKSAKSCTEFKVDRLLVEAKASGISVAQELHHRYAHSNWAVELADPGKGDKVARAYAVTQFFEEGVIWVPGFDDGTLRKWAEKVVDQMATFPKSAHDDLCFVAGTQIATKRGSIPIEDVNQTDMVLTPCGWRRVVASGMTGIAETISRFGLTGTASHPIFSYEGGYVPLGDLPVDAKLSRLTLCGLIKIARQRLLHLTAFHTGGWEASAITTLAAPSPIQKDCTSLSGKIITGMSRRATKFTTETATLLIAALTIWSAYRRACIVECLRELIGRRFSSIWKLSDPSLWRGIVLMRVVRGIAKTPRPAFENQVPGNHSKTFEEPEFANGVGCLSNIATRARFFAQTSALNNAAAIGAVDTGSSTQMQLVFNLTVEDAHCYYANEILVHNCDTATMGIRYLRETGLLLRKEEQVRITTEALTFKSRQRPLYQA